MKVGIIAVNNIRISPYIFFYTNILDSAGIEYEIIFPQRNGYVDPMPVKTFELSWDSSKNSLLNYIHYRNDVIKVIKQQKYDFLILLTTVSAVFLGGWLKKKYPQKYLVDVRDYTYESNRAYFWAEKRVLKHSALNMISSPGFREFLPAGVYQLCHNVKNNWKPQNIHWTKHENRIRIGYVGAITYTSACKWLMDLVKNDDRFSFDFYGSGVGEKTLREYAEQLQCDRIAFHGLYRPEEKKDIIQNVDILFNAYGNDRLIVKTALSNKLYDALYYKKLILTSTDTAMAQMAGPLSFSVNRDMKSLDDLYAWYQNLDNQTLDAYADETLRAVMDEQRVAIQKVKDVITSNVKA